MVKREFNVRLICIWDAAAEIWVAESPDVTGFVTEATDVSALIRRAMDIIPDLIEANHMGGSTRGNYEINLTPVYRHIVRESAQ